MATFNGEKFLDKQINSILSQSLTPDSIIIVDDCSTDKTFDIANEWLAKYPNIIKLYKNSKNIGFIRNFEKGISLCKTHYIALSDQDDIWHTEKIKKCINKLSEDDNIGLCYHNAELIDVDGNDLGVSLQELSELKFPLDKLIAQNSVINDYRSPIRGFTIVFNSILKPYILPIPGKASCGHDWWISAISFYLFNPVYIENPLAKYRIHENQATGPGSTILKGTPYALKKKITFNRIVTNIKKEVIRTFSHHKKRAQKRMDKEQRIKDTNEAIEKLSIFVKKSDHLNKNEKQKLIATLNQKNFSIT